VIAPDVAEWAARRVAEAPPPGPHALVELAAILSGDGEYGVPSGEASGEAS
jgi:hypothetical protein